MIPYYRGERHIEECLASLIGQSDPDWLATVIDDGSPDLTARELTDEITDRRIRYLRHDTNRGISATFSEALEQSRGSWTTILGQDDRLLPNYVSVVGAAAGQASLDVAMVHPRVRSIDAAGQPTASLTDSVKAALTPRGIGNHSGELLAVSLLVGNWLYFPAIAWRTEPAREIGFDSSLLIAMDLELMLRQVVSGRELLLLSETCFEYRRHTESASSRATRTSRFDEERELHRRWARTMRAARWRKAALAARLRPASRIHSLRVLHPVRSKIS